MRVHPFGADETPDVGALQVAERSIRASSTYSCHTSVAAKSVRSVRSRISVQLQRVVAATRQCPVDLLRLLQPACRHPHLDLVPTVARTVPYRAIARAALRARTTHPDAATTFPFRSSFTGTYRARSIFGNNSWRSLCEVATLAQQLEVLVRSQPSIHDHRRLTRPPGGATGAAVHGASSSTARGSRRLSSMRAMLFSSLVLPVNTSCALGKPSPSSTRPITTCLQSGR